MDHRICSKSISNVWPRTFVSRVMGLWIWRCFVCPLVSPLVCLCIIRLELWGLREFSNLISPFFPSTLMDSIFGRKSLQRNGVIFCYFFNLIIYLFFLSLRHNICRIIEKTNVYRLWVTRLPFSLRRGDIIVLTKTKKLGRAKTKRGEEEEKEEKEKEEEEEEESEAIT